MYKHDPLGAPTGKNISELDPTTQKVMQSALDLESTFHMSNSPTAAHLPHSALELGRAEITTSASKLEAHLQVDPLQHFSENHDMFEQLGCQVAGMGPRQCPRQFKTKSDAEADLIHAFADTMRIIPCHR
jgi:hypothetical protein